MEHFSDEGDPDGEISEPSSEEGEEDIVELTLSGDPNQLVVSMQQVEDADWGPYYKVCPTFGKFWDDTQDASKVCPEKIKVFGCRMYQEESLCVPTPIQKPFIRLTHDKLGHVGAARLLQGLTRGCKWADYSVAKIFGSKTV